MQVTETLTEGLKRGFTVVVPAADIEARRTARLTDLGKTLRLPGFRPGKVPLPVVRQRYGMAVTAEVMEESVSEATRRVLSDRGLRPALQPKVDVVSLDTGAGAASDLEFKVEVELLPEITLPDFSGISVTRMRAEVPPDRTDMGLSELQRRFSTLEEITAEELESRGHGAAKDEALTFDYLGRIDGEERPELKSSDVTVQVGGPDFLPGFTEKLEGIRPGETRNVPFTFPTEHPNEALAGKEAAFEVTAKKLSRAILPALDDEFAKKLGFDDLAALRETIRLRGQNELDALSRLRLKRQLLDALSDLAVFTPPQGMVDQEFEQIWQRLEEERKAGRLDEDDKGKDEDTLRTDYRAIADRRVRLGLLLAEIGRANGITVGEDETAQAMRMEASRFPGREAQMMEFFRKNPRAVDTLRGPIFEDKVIDFVLELAKVTDQTVTPDELAQEPPVATRSAEAAGKVAAEAEASGGETGAEAAPATPSQS